MRTSNTFSTGVLGAKKDTPTVSQVRCSSEINRCEAEADSKQGQGTPMEANDCCVQSYEALSLFVATSPTADNSWSSSESVLSDQFHWNFGLRGFSIHQEGDRFVWTRRRKEIKVRTRWRFHNNR